MKYVQRMLHGFLGLAVMAGAELAVADVLDTSKVIRGDTAMQGPSRGSSMDQVLARFGEPVTRMSPVGGDKPLHPPITRWVYSEFTVYFEHDKVIDSVSNNVTASTAPGQ
jgi:hypothetical protein